MKMSLKNTSISISKDQPPDVPSRRCFSFNLFSCFINSWMPTGTPLYSSLSQKSLAILPEA